jgi:hypothetical protein
LNSNKGNLNGLPYRAQANNFYFFTHFDYTLLHTSCHHGSTTLITKPITKTLG